LVFENMLKPVIDPIQKNIRQGSFRIPYNILLTVKTFVFACFACIFFRANNISDAFVLIGNIFHLGTIDWSSLMVQLPKFAIIAILGMSLVQFIRLQTGGEMRDIIAKQPVLVRWSAYVVLLLVIAFYGSFHSQSEFIYFQF